MIARIAEGTKEDIDLAVKASRLAFDHGPWPRMPAVVRYHLLPPVLFLPETSFNVKFTREYYFLILIFY